jgi:hypothetical protein
MLNRRLPIIAAVAVFGIYGTSASAATTNDVCNVPTTCALFDDTSSGQGVRAEANTGYGIYSTSLTGTGFFSSTGSGVYLNPGIDGESTNESGQDAAALFGFQGNSAGTPPAYGALSYGSVYGLYGFASNAGSAAASPGYGVFGQDNRSGSGADYNVGVAGSSSFGTGVLGTANASPTINLIGELPIGIYAVSAPAPGGTQSVSLEAEGPSYVLEARNTAAHTFFDAVTNANLIAASGGSGSFSVTNTGNASVSGTLTTSKGVYEKSRGASGTIMTSYGQRSTVPTLEDMGEAQLVNGRAAIAIDAKLTDAIDHRTNYLVFLTPQGENKGLYVTQKNANGFLVREQDGGRSTLAFDYRIVAKPFDQDGARLAVSASMGEPVVPAPLHGAHVSQALSPADRLRNRLGPAGFAKAIRSLRAGAPR